MYQTLYATVEAEITTATICIDQTVFGRQVIDEEIREIAAKRFGIASGFSKVKDLLLTIKVRHQVHFQSIESVIGNRNDSRSACSVQLVTCIFALCMTE